MCFQQNASSSAQSRAETTVLPTPVSLPVMKKRSGMHGTRSRKVRPGLARNADLGYEAADVLRVKLAVQSQANSRRAGGNRWRPNRLHRKPTYLQLSRNVQRHFVG